MYGERERERERERGAWREREREVRAVSAITHPINKMSDGMASMHLRYYISIKDGLKAMY